MLISESYKKRAKEIAGISERYGSGLLSEIDAKETIVKKLGLSQEIADWADKISPKLAVWIADKVKKDSSLYPKSESDFRLIADWARSGDAKDIKSLSFEQALEQAEQAHSKFVPIDKSLKNFDVVLNLGNYKWVKINNVSDCSEEGEAMGHCMGDENYGHPEMINSGEYLAYSLRDKYNKPHITIEIEKEDGDIIEFKGKQNETPASKYMPYAIEFLKKKKDLWKKISDNTFWKSLGNNKTNVLKLYKEIPSLFTIREKLIFDFPISKGELNIKGNLNLRGTDIHYLPDNLNIGMSLYLAGTAIQSLPNNLSVSGDIDLSYASIMSLPDGLKVGGDLNLAYTKIQSLPDNLSVGRGLNLYQTPIEFLPDNLSVSGSLDLAGTKIQSLPDNLSVGKSLDLAGTKIQYLPDNLSVGGSLYLGSTKIQSLPDNLSVGGDLDLYQTPIEFLPDNLKVGREIHLGYTPLSKNKTEEEIRTMAPGVQGKISI